LEIQLAGYACLRAAETIGSEFPRWLVSNWGSDLLLYEKLGEHRSVLQTLAGRADAFISECHRDIGILRNLGYRKYGTYVLPASGGADFDALGRFAARSAPSRRREVVVKGYHGWSGRGVHVLSALVLAARALSGFLIRIVLASPSVVENAQLFARNSELDVVVEPWFENHSQALDRLSRARIMVGIGISDGIGTSLLEAMALGAFPVVARTACADEWIRQAKDGFFVDVHDIGTLAQALERAASDDELVDAAARRNRSEVERRWNVRVNRDVAFAIYDTLAAGAE
jgi:hypothetical protein